MSFVQVTGGREMKPETMSRRPARISIQRVLILSSVRDVVMTSDWQHSVHHVVVCQMAKNLGSLGCLLVSNVNSVIAEIDRLRSKCSALFTNHVGLTIPLSFLCRAPLL